MTYKKSGRNPRASASTGPSQLSLSLPTGEVSKNEAPGNEPTERPTRLSMEQTQRIVHARFASAGIRLQPEHQIHERNLALALSGFDPERRVGYMYIATGVPELSRETERALRELAGRGEAYIMIVYEDDMPDVDVLERHIDGFFTGLPPARLWPPTLP